MSRDGLSSTNFAFTIDQPGAGSVAHSFFTTPLCELMTFPTASARFEGQQNEWRLNPLEGDPRSSPPSIEFLDEYSSGSDVEEQLTRRSDYTLHPVTVWQPLLPINFESLPTRVRRKARASYSSHLWAGECPVNPPFLQVVTIPEASSSGTTLVHSTSPSTAHATPRPRKRSKKTTSKKRVAETNGKLPALADQTAASKKRELKGPAPKRRRKESEKAIRQGDGSDEPPPKRQRVTRSIASRSVDDSSTVSSCKSTRPSTPESVVPGPTSPSPDVSFDLSEASEKIVSQEISPLRFVLKFPSRTPGRSARTSRESSSTPTRRSPRFGQTLPSHPVQIAV